MSDYELVPGLYVAPSPAGAYYAVSGTKMDGARRVLLHLMSLDSSPELTPDLFQEINGLDTDDPAGYLHRMQSMHLLEGFPEPRARPADSIENAMPGLLGDLAGPKGKALLADEHGFYLSTHGFPHETAEELAALAADVGGLDQRHRRLLEGNLALQTSAWGLLTAGGNSELGFWPLYVGSVRFSLVLKGRPRLNKAALVDVVWMLVNRYGSG
ncbi:hypothetical protein [Thioalkalivibrio paradoxus]|uniref:Roadblock/LAMTOR2 domain-containing protein n=1 Tax=Thioalkalivibrio paradoxus ARh 1 TaxID=713585 RepID=W0DJ89_9GAMM|nr:hypothetical protein [Thioalkalivibrio paradoxus]AHE97068.1 hypothetical protein THITH_00885 [Thioalkalivibrio paradoxus ARh 1]